MTAATTIAVLTIAALIITKWIGAIIVAAFFAGVGVTLTIVLLIVASLMADGKKE